MPENKMVFESSIIKFVKEHPDVEVRIDVRISNAPFITMTDASDDKALKRVTQVISPYDGPCDDIHLEMILLRLYGMLGELNDNS